MSLRPKVPAKRPLESSDAADESDPKRQAVDEIYVPFGGQEREVFLSTRVHKKLHAQVASLSDAELEEIGLASFNSQFGMLEAKLQSKGEISGGLGQTMGPLFGGVTRDEFMAARVHRRVHAAAAGLSDEKLNELGHLSFNQQITAMEDGSLGAASTPRKGGGKGKGSAEMFGGAGRDAFMREHVHKKLHNQAVSLSDQDLQQLGQMKFNDQFDAVERMMSMPSPARASRFGSPVGSRVGPPVGSYAGAGKAAGKSEGKSDGKSKGKGLPPGGDRNAYMQERVHRKIHDRAAMLSDQDLSELGQMTFNDQFDAVERMCANTHAAAATFHQYSAGSLQGSANLFGPAGRDGYMQQRIHRKIHGQAAAVSDDDLFQLGKLSFNEQFDAVQQMTVVVGGGQSLQSHAVDCFGGAGREQYMAEHVHRKLHDHCHALSDQELAELGRLKFNDQFPYLGLDAEQAVSSKGSGKKGTDIRDIRGTSNDPFGGLSRDEYMTQRVHRKLHSHCTDLADEDLLQLGKKSFNDQFPWLGLESDGGPSKGAPSKGKGKGKSHHQPVNFEGLSRDEFIATRVHRKLHGYAVALSDQDLLDFGRQKFNDQFLMLEQGGSPAPQRQVQASHGGGGGFGGLSRDEYMRQRIHRRLHIKAVTMPDEELLDVGKLSFNEQFVMFEQFEEMAKSAGVADSGNVFGGLNRDDYMRSRVHRRLHAEAAKLSDEQLLQLGQVSFNEQFPKMEQMGLPEDGNSMFPDGDRDGYMSSRIHRKLQPQLAGMSDQEVLEFGKLSFNEQFTMLGFPSPGA